MKTSKDNHNTILWRIKEVERSMGQVETKLDKILENDLPHIHEQIGSLKARITVIAGLNIAAIVFGIIMSKLL